MGDYWGYLGSYTALYQEHVIPVPKALRGPLVQNFTVNGKVEGKLASIYISPNALVENIIVAPGAEIKGDIISLWDPDETIYGKRHLYYGEDPRGTTLLSVLPMILILIQKRQSYLPKTPAPRSFLTITLSGLRASYLALTMCLL